MFAAMSSRDVSADAEHKTVQSYDFINQAGSQGSSKLNFYMAIKGDGEELVDSGLGKNMIQTARVPGDRKNLQSANESRTKSVSRARLIVANAIGQDAEIHSARPRVTSAHTTAFSQIINPANHQLLNNFGFAESRPIPMSNGNVEEVAAENSQPINISSALNLHRELSEMNISQKNINSMLRL